MLEGLPIYKSATNNREVGFKPVNQLATQILDNVCTLNIPQQTINDVASIVHKIHGYSKKIVVNTTDPTAAKQSTGTGPTPIPITPVVDGVSTSQQSYDNLLAHFDKLIQLLLGISAYAPNEANIKVPALQTLVASLKTLNTAAITASNAWALARNQRNLVFYAANTGMYDITKKVKKYIRQISGSTSAVYHQATALKFVKIVPRAKKKKTKK